MVPDKKLHCCASSLRGQAGVHENLSVFALRSFPETVELGKMEEKVSCQYIRIPFA